MTHHDNDSLAARLRAALNAEADMVHPSDDGMQNIRSRTARGRAWWQHPAVLAAAAAVVLGLLVGGGAALFGGGDDAGTVAAGPTTSAPGQATSTDSPSPSPTAPATTSSTEPTESASGEQPVYVYFVQDDPDSGPRLYREEHIVAAGPPSAAVAVQEMLSEPPIDPDYSSPWPTRTRLTGYQVIGDTARVDLSGFPAVGAQAEAVAVQQLVYTVTANDKAVRRVRLLVDGTAPASGHADWSRPVARAPMVDVQALVWLLAPSQDEVVPPKVRISGYGTAFEGTVSWEVRRVGATGVVADGFAQAGANGEFDEFQDAVTLEPGEYEIRAFESSAEDGRPLHVDSKTFTVR